MDIIILFSIGLVLIVIAVHASADDIIFLGDFERGDLTGFYWHYNKPEVVSSPHPVRAGIYSMRNYLHRYESSYPDRCDLHVGSSDSQPAGTRSVLRLNIGDEYWTGLSIYVPPDFVPDREGRDEIFFQFHGSPDKDSEGDYIEDWRNPPFSIRIHESNWEFSIIADSKKITPPRNTPGRYTYSKRIVVPMGNDIGKWTDFIINIKFNYNGNGFTKIWKDEELVVNLTGPNTFNDDRGPYPAMGLYKWSWDEEKYESNMDWRLLYIDELRIGGAGATYEDVAPSGSPPPSEPSPPPISGLSWQAEDGIITSPFKVENGYVYQSTQTTDPSVAGKASYRFNIDNAEDYIIKMVVDAEDGSDNSLFVNIDSEPSSPTMIWDIEPLTTGFEERSVSWRGSGTYDKNEFVPKIFSLTEGEHELIIRGRESYTLIDSITIEPYSTSGKLVGDTDNDGDVDIFDIWNVISHFGKTSGFVNRIDQKEDNKIDLFDLVVVARHFGEKNSETETPSNTPPEPPPSSDSDRQGIIFVGDFEDNDLRGFYWHYNKPEVVSATHPVREGTYSMRSYLHRYDSSYTYRTQVIPAASDDLPPDTQQTFRFDIGKEYWFGYSMYVPSDFVADFPGITDNVGGWQASPDTGEDYRIGCLALFIDEDRWKWRLSWDERAFTPDESWPHTMFLYEAKMGSSIGSWTDWVLNVKFSPNDDGFVKLWRNRELVATYHGSVCSNDQKGPYLQMGVYKWSWKPWHDPPYESKMEERLFYYDAFRIGDSSAGHDDVAPGSFS